MQPLGHMLVVHHSMNRVLPKILSSYPCHAYSGSLGPDWFYNLHGGIGGYSEVSDAMHSYGSRTVYLTMLDVAKNMGNDKNLGIDAYRCFEAARAFAHGFISHIAADCVYHPYVNRRANNPWTGDKFGASAHAGVETVIDNILWKNYGNFDIQVNCAQLGNHAIADYPVRRVLISGLATAYSNQNWLLNMLQVSADNNNEDHPINSAFRAVRQWSALTEGLQLTCAYNVNDIIQHLKSMSLADVDKETALNLERLPWCNIDGNENLNHSAEDLFSAAVTASTNAIMAGERYINGEINSFDNCGMPFLERDYNIDTGLPSDENTTIHSVASDLRFSVATNLLVDNYKRYLV
jgi:hypothetical protein